MAIELRHLRYVAILAEELHFGRAAQRANVTQSGLSQQIQRLETLVGARLFERTSRWVRLTPAGEAFLGETRGVAERIEAAAALARQVDHRSRRVIDVGYSPMTLQTPVGRIMQAFKERSGDVEIRLHEHWSDELFARLRDGDLDLAFMAPIARDGNLESIEIAREKILVSLPPGHRLRDRSVVEIADLKGEPIIYAPEQFAPTRYNALVKACAAEGFEPQFIEQAVEVPKLLMLVAAGVGLGFITQGFAGLAPPEVTLRPLGPPMAEHIITLAWRRSTTNLIIEAFVDVAREVCRTR